MASAAPTLAVSWASAATAAPRVGVLSPSSPLSPDALWCFDGVRDEIDAPIADADAAAAATAACTLDLQFPTAGGAAVTYVAVESNARNLEVAKSNQK